MDIEEFLEPNMNLINVLSKWHFKIYVSKMPSSQKKMGFQCLEWEEGEESPLGPLFHLRPPSILSPFDVSLSIPGHG